MKVFRKSVAIVGIALSLFAASPVLAEGEMGDLQPKQVQMVLKDVNTATVQELQDVKGIGPKKAEKVKEYIDENGPIGKMSDLQEVKGIGPKTLQNMEEVFGVED